MRPRKDDDREAREVAARLYAAEDTVNARRAFMDGVRWGRAHPESEPATTDPQRKLAL